MSKKFVKINKKMRSVQETLEPVIDRNRAVLVEMRKHGKAHNYWHLSDMPESALEHRPERMHRPYHGEFEVFFDHPHYIKEGREEQHPPTLSTKHTVNYIKCHYLMNDDELCIDPIYRNKKDDIAFAIMVSMGDDGLRYVDDERLRLLDEMFYSCGYFRSAQDKVYDRGNGGGMGIRVLQYEAYHYE